ncbi:MAG: FdtA/QdtA family cupin domain-containing protein [Thermoanaerobaculia bacterium]
MIELPRVQDARGNLTFIESLRHVPFRFERVYWIYDVPGGERRGGHAYRTAHEFLIALSGSFDVVLDDGSASRVMPLNRSYFGVYVPNLVWRHLQNFSTNTVCLVLTSTPYTESDYIRDYDEFKKVTVAT